MKSVRLNESLRRTIINNILSSFTENYFSEKEYKSIDELAIEIENEKQQAMVELWDSIYGIHKNSLDALPEWMKSGNPFTVARASNENYISARLKDRSGKPNACDLVLSPEQWENCFGRMNALNKEQEQYKKESNNFKQEIESIINSVSTTKQLIELWSDVEVFIPKSIIDPNNIKLPIINIDTINRKIGL